jgi:hypothetical protein
MPWYGWNTTEVGIKHQSVMILVMPRYGWNTANDGVKHQSINQSWYWWCHYMAEKLVKLVLNINQSTNQSSYWWCHGMAEMLLMLALNIYQNYSSIITTKTFWTILLLVKNSICTIWFSIMIDWLMFNFNFNSISAISWHHQYHDWLIDV